MPPLPNSTVIHPRGCQNVRYLDFAIPAKIPRVIGRRGWMDGPLSPTGLACRPWAGLLLAIQNSKQNALAIETFINLDTSTVSGGHLTGGEETRWMPSWR